jgi:5'-deoxynucleotidase YfbR-like HD superfamily hydrolase
MSKAKPEDVVVYLIQAFEVKRWHTETVLREQNVGNHSARVVMWITLFHPNPSAALLKAAALHDVEERVTGDIPHWAKHTNPNLRIAAAEVERTTREHFGLGFELSDEDRTWLEASDLFDAWLHIWQETQIFRNAWMEVDYVKCTQKIQQRREQNKFPDALHQVCNKLARINDES